MTAKFLCVEQRSDSYTGKRGPVTQQILTLMDLSPQHRLLSTLDFVLRPEEVEQLKGASLRDQHVEVAITGLELGFGNRIKARGHLLLKAQPQPAKA